MTNSCTCKAEHWQPHKVDCPAYRPPVAPTSSVATLRLLAKCGSMDLSVLGPIADEMERMQGLLGAAACPNRSVPGHEGAWQCQWCDERKSALSGALEPNPRASRAIEVLRAERDGAMAQRDWYIQLLARFWKITPPDFKTSDGRTMRFVDPDPQRSLRIIRDAMVEAQRQIESEHAEKSGGGQ